MNTATTLRTNSTLQMSNRNGSVHIVPFAKGTPIAAIAEAARRIHLESIDESDIYSRPRLFSDATGKELATEIPFQHAPVAPRTPINLLSPRMKEVFAIRHLSDAEIASEIGCSAAAVEAYRRQINERICASAQL